jgi:hypothetical protein
MMLLYENVELVNRPNETTSNDYENNRLPDTYSWISPHVHSNPTTHFWQPAAGNTYWNEIVPIGPPAHFYNLFACSNCRFTTQRYMGGVYSFAAENGLAAVGSTTSGAMLWFVYFYGPLGGGGSLGEAYELWWDYIANYGLSQTELNWHIGMVLLGDPSLVPSMHLTGVEEEGGPEGPHSISISVDANPSDGSPVAHLELSAPTSALVCVYDVSGRLVEELSLPGLASGQHLVQLGRIEEQGTYFVRATASGSSCVESFVVLE